MIRIIAKDPSQIQFYTGGSFEFLLEQALITKCPEGTGVFKNVVAAEEMGKARELAPANVVIAAAAYLDRPVAGNASREQLVERAQLFLRTEHAKRVDKFHLKNLFREFQKIDADTALIAALLGPEEVKKLEPLPPPPSGCILA